MHSCTLFNTCRQTMAMVCVFLIWMFCAQLAGLVCKMILALIPGMI